jgi:hypothetical protein
MVLFWVNFILEIKTNNMAVIIVYDVSGKQAELKEKLIEKGYKDQLKGAKFEIIYFSNKTLYHSTKTSKQARDEVRNICESLNIELKWCIDTIWDDWSLTCGESFDH